MIGLAAVMLMALLGKIAGPTGILGAFIPPFAKDLSWRAAFLTGAIVAPSLYVLSGFGPVDFGVPTPLRPLIVGGVLVGIGVTFASGCTAGHGVCGIARLSPRSIVATITFMTVALLTVYVTRHLIGF